MMRKLMIAGFCLLASTFSSVALASQVNASGLKYFENLLPNPLKNLPMKNCMGKTGAAFCNCMQKDEINGCMNKGFDKKNCENNNGQVASNLMAMVCSNVEFACEEYIVSTKLPITISQCVAQFKQFVNQCKADYSYSGSCNYS